MQARETAIEVRRVIARMRVDQLVVQRESRPGLGATQQDGAFDQLIDGRQRIEFARSCDLLQSLSGTALRPSTARARIRRTRPAGGGRPRQFQDLLFLQQRKRADTRGAQGREGAGREGSGDEKRQGHRG